MRAIKRFVFSAVVATTIAAAILFSLARLLFPVIGGYRADIESMVSHLLGQQVRIGELDARWRGVYPSLKLGGVELLAADGTAVLGFKEVQVDIDWLALLSEGRLEAGAVTIVGSDVAVERDEQGCISLVGVETASSGANQDDTAHTWLLTRKHIALRDATIRWRDRQYHRAPLVFSGIQVELRNDGEQHRLSARGALPATLGREIKAAFDFTGDPFETSSAWSATGFVQGAGLQLRTWAEQLGFTPNGIAAGSLDVSAWPEFRDGKLQRVDTEFASHDGKLVAAVQHAPPRQVLNYDSLSGRAAWQRAEHGWELALDRLVMSRDKRAWAPARVVLHIDDLDSGRAVEGYVSAVRLDELAAVAMWWPETAADVVRQLSEYKPRGQLQDVYFKRRPETGAAPRYFFRADAVDLGWAAVDKAPGADGIDGTVVADNDTVYFAATTRNARVQLDRLFRNPIELSSLEGWVAATREASGWRVHADELALANADVALDVTLSIDGIGGKNVPEIDLTGRFRDGHAAKKSLYLPAHIMPESLVAWLDQGIVGGHVIEGGVTVRGPLNRFPFVEGDGRFQVRFAIEDGELDFAPGWPHVDRIKAEVAFNEQSMSITATSARTVDNPLSDVHVDIADMIHHQAELRIAGRAAGSLTNGLRYLNESPLKKNIGVFFAQNKSTGSVGTELKIMVPLFGETRHVAVAGNVAFNDNNLTLLDADVDMTHIDGTLAFTENGVSADKLRATVLGQPATVNVRSESVGGHNDIIIAAQGQTRLSALRQRLQLSVLQWLDGETDWRGELRIPGASAADDRAVKLAITSALNGTRVKLPGTLGKAPSASSTLDLRMTLPFKAGRPLMVAYGENLRGIFELMRGGQNRLQLNRGEIRLYDGAAALPERSGIRVAGKLPTFVQSEWQPFLFPDDNAATGGDSGGGSGAAGVNQLDVVAQEATLLGRAFGKLIVRGEADSRGWMLQLGGDRVDGQLSVPAQNTMPVRLDLQRLELVSVKPPTGAAKDVKDAKPPPGPRTDPRRIPALQLLCKQFVYEQRQMGELSVELEKTSDGVHLASSAIDDGVTRLKATGDWTARALDNQKSELDVQLQSGNIGRALAMFGYAETIRDGKGEGAARVTWPDTLDNFAAGLLSGTVSFKVENGRVLDVEPGAGRIFGLLSVQALPRRLTLDFSDFFSKGFAFDKVEGAYTLTSGVAHTNSFNLTGPAAQIDIDGDIDMGRRTYAQTVKVVPNLTGSLPVIAIGAGVVATPIAGAAALIAEKLLRKPVGKLTQVTYRVTGPWDSPTVQALARKEINAEAAKNGAKLPASPR